MLEAVFYLEVGRNQEMTRRRLLNVYPEKMGMSGLVEVCWCWAVEAGRVGEDGKEGEI